MKYLLITLSKKLKRNDSIADPTKGFYEEADMFYTVRIEDKKIYLGPLVLDEDTTRKEADARDMHLVDFLEKGVQNDASLLTYCKQNRVGYNRQNSSKPASKLISNLKRIEKLRWQAFITKILKQRNDMHHLKEFLANGA